MSLDAGILPEELAVAWLLAGFCCAFVGVLLLLVHGGIILVALLFGGDPKKRWAIHFLHIPTIVEALNTLDEREKHYTRFLIGGGLTVVGLGLIGITSLFGWA